MPHVFSNSGHVLLINRHEEIETDYYFVTFHRSKKHDNNRSSVMKIITSFSPQNYEKLWHNKRNCMIIFKLILIIQLVGKVCISHQIICIIYANHGFEEHCSKFSFELLSGFTIALLVQRSLLFLLNSCVTDVEILTCLHT